MTNQITKIQALLMYDSKWWEAMDDIQVARFQLGQRILCMPFDEFHRCVEVALGRPVWTHEFADPKALSTELAARAAWRSTSSPRDVQPADAAMDREICEAAKRLVDATHAAADAFSHGIASEHGMSLLANSARHKALADAVAEAGVALARAVDHRAGRTS